MASTNIEIYSMFDKEKLINILVDKHIYYNRILRETNLDGAQQRESIVEFAKNIGYV